MVKLLVLADDFTGSLDTGVQFRAKGTRLRFAAEGKNMFEGLDEDVRVLIVDTESRHLPPQQAAKLIGSIVSDAVRAGVSCIYKKTDSGLRGNIGAELGAALEASGRARLHFVPAYPQVNRVTRQGVQYISGVPVAESVFGADPFNPVHFSGVDQIINSQNPVPVTLVQGDTLPEAGIALYDAETMEDLQSIAQTLRRQQELHMLAGCAGFASVLPQLLELEPAEDSLPAFAPRLLTVCGSINPITLEQLDTAEAAGIPRIRLSPRQKLDPAWLESPAGDAAIGSWVEIAEGHPSAIIECGGLEQPEETETLRKELGLTPEQMRCRIAETMGSVLKKVLDTGLEATLLVTGGDTLLACMGKLNQNELIPLREISTGVVLSRIQYNGKEYNLLSKSGGFGTKHLLSQLEEALVHNH